MHCISIWRNLWNQSIRLGGEMNWTLAGHVLFLATALIGAWVLYGRRISLKRSKEKSSNPGSAALETCLAMSFLIATSLLPSEALAIEPFELGIKAYHD